MNRNVTQQNVPERYLVHAGPSGTLRSSQILDRIQNYALGCDQEFSG